MPIQDNDLFMVSRDNNTYQITAKEIKDSYYGQPIVEEDSTLGSLRIEEDTQGVFTHTSGTNPDDLTISFWYKPIEFMASSGVVNILNFTNSDGSHSLEIGINHPQQTKLQVKHTKTGFSSTTTYFNAPMHDDTAWHHIHLVITNSDLTYYSKGRLVEKYAHTTASSLPLGTDYNMYLHDNTMQVSKGYGQIAHLTVIDGQAVLPDQTGYFNENNQWSPKKYAGSYGTNGGFWKFNHTDADTSGNNNNITLTGLVDYSYDAPTNNYVTLTAHVISQARVNSGEANFIIAKGGTYFKKTGSAMIQPKAQGSYLPPTGIWYWEVTIESLAETYNTEFGIILAGNNESQPYNTLMAYQGNGNFIDKGSTYSVLTPTWKTGDVIGLAWDADLKELSMWQNGTFQHKYDCKQNNPTITPWDSAVPWIKIDGVQNTAVHVNFGQKDWVYEPPEGCTPVNTNEILRKYDQPKIHEHVASDWNQFANTNELNFGNVPCDVVIGSFPYGSSEFYIVNQVANVENEQKGLFPIKQGTSGVGSAELGDFSDDNRKFILSNTTVVNEIGSSNNAFQGLGIRAGTKTESLSVGDLNYTRSVNKELGFAVIKFKDMPNSNFYNIPHGLDAIPHSVLVVEEKSTSSFVMPWKIGSTRFNPTEQSSIQYGNAMNSISSGSVLQASNVNSNTVAYTMEGTGYKNIALYVISGNFARTGNYNGTTLEQGRHVYLGFKPKFIWFKNVNATNQIQQHSKPHIIMKNDQNNTSGGTPNWTEYDWTESGKVRHWRDCTNKNSLSGITTATAHYFEPTANGFILRTSNQALNSQNIRYFAIGDTHWLHS